ncbi:MAG TPA: carboxypeptidase-like regulatory domain-containing protein, partial [Flavisolibacter sp.]|nr:carboxypeptidase-like regulatory domain-containing protein [Flavisolibacter sp.]
MRKSIRFSVLALTMLLSSIAFSQQLLITGNVKNGTTSEYLSSVSIIVKSTGQGTYTDPNGNFRISVKTLPVTLVITSIGFDLQEVTVTSASAPLVITLNPGTSLGQEVVVSATRTPQRILESPVSIERLSLANLVNAAV